MAGEFTLDMANENVSLRVTGIGGHRKIRLHMLQMGITPGTCVEVLRRAPLADPVEIMVRGTKLALRNEEAKNIIVVEAE